MKTMTFNELSDLYCERQECEPEQLRETLSRQQEMFNPDGWMLLECQMMDSSRLGERTILAYGPNNTYAEPPSGPVSPRGLASDMSMVIGVMPASELS